MKSNGKQFTVTLALLTAVARDQSVQLKVAWCCSRNLSAFFKICFCFVLFCYITSHLITGPLGNSEFCFPRISLFPETKKNSLFPSGPVMHEVLIMFFYPSHEKTHVSFKRALDHACQVVKSPPELPAVAQAMAFYKTLHGKEDQKKQEAGNRLVFHERPLKSYFWKVVIKAACYDLVWILRFWNPVISYLPGLSCSKHG